MFSGSERLDLAACEIEQLQMRVTLRQITVDVFFEKEPINDQRWDRLLFFLLFLWFARIGIMDDERDPFRIGRPGEIFDAAFRVGDFLGFTTTDWQQPELIVL